MHAGGGTLLVANGSSAVAVHPHTDLSLIRQELCSEADRSAMLCNQNMNRSQICEKREKILLRHTYADRVRVSLAKANFKTDPQAAPLPLFKFLRCSHSRGRVEPHSQPCFGQSSEGPVCREQNAGAIGLAGQHIELRKRRLILLYVRLLFSTIAFFLYRWSYRNHDDVREAARNGRMRLSEARAAFDIAPANGLFHLYNAPRAALECQATWRMSHEIS